MRGRFVRVLGIILVLGCLVLLLPAITYAEVPTKSDNYQFDESSIGSDGLLDASSNSYRADNATGDLVVGNTASGDYQIETGSQTTSDPALSVAITGTGVNFNDFSPATAATATATFTVSNYTSYGYVVQIIGDPPKNNDHTIQAMDENNQSLIGVEQFGINLVANTQPASFGADPDNGQFGFGEAALNYNTPNSYRYVNGETIAMAPKSSGVTEYTISYIVNVTSLTPGGHYDSNQTIIITGTY